jgi:hypothetical protein
MGCVMFGEPAAQMGLPGLVKWSHRPHQHPGQLAADIEATEFYLRDHIHQRAIESQLSGNTIRYSSYRFSCTS